MHRLAITWNPVTDEVNMIWCDWAIWMSINDMLWIKPKSMEIPAHKPTERKRVSASAVCQTLHDAGVGFIAMPQWVRAALEAQQGMLYEVRGFNAGAD